MVALLTLDLVALDKKTIKVDLTTQFSEIVLFQSPLLFSRFNVPTKLCYLFVIF